MSYRLINANALAANCKQVNDMPCIYADLPNGMDGGFYDMTGRSNNSRWHELFGTTERAARTIASVLCDYRADSLFCEECPLYDGCYGTRPMTEWLRG